MTRYCFKSLYLALFLLACINFGACSHHDEDIRKPADILGIWSPNANHYLEFSDDNTVRNLTIEYQDGESIGNWESEVYYYEPGYNLVIYITSHQEGEVYEIVELTSSRLTWCPVDKIDILDREDSIGKIIGDIIKKAQEGYELNPELYVNFNKISQDEFFNVLENLDLIYPWDPWM